MVIAGQNGTYEIVRRQLAKDSYLNYHICCDKTGRWLILVIASTAANNAVVDRMEYLLRQLSKNSEIYEQEFARQSHPEHRLHYDWLFPQVVDSLALEKQDNRHVSILDFPDVDLQKAFALKQITQGGQRIDLKTSAWIMGRFLKLLGFLHECNISVPILTSNFLIEPDNHRLLMLNWTSARIGEVPAPAQRCIAIKQAAECTLLLLGAEYQEDTWHYSYELQGNEAQYIWRLQDMHSGKYCDAFQAHSAFYEVVDSLWGKKFHPFTTYRLND